MSKTNDFSKISSCLNSLNNEEKKLITENIIELKYKKGENICKQGSFSSCIVYINRGFAKRYIEHKEKNFILNISRNGDFIGLSSLFYSDTFMYSAAGIEDCYVSSKQKHFHSNN
jgi:CRP-like cAMP-binding protein